MKGYLTMTGMLGIGMLMAYSGAVAPVGAARLPTWSLALIFLFALAFVAAFFVDYNREVWRHPTSKRADFIQRYFIDAVGPMIYTCMGNAFLLVPGHVASDLALPQVSEATVLLWGYTLVGLAVLQATAVKLMLQRDRRPLVRRTS